MRTDNGATVYFAILANVAIRAQIKDAYYFQLSNVNFDRLFALIYVGAVIIIANASARRYE